VEAVAPSVVVFAFVPQAVHVGVAPPDQNRAQGQVQPLLEVSIVLMPVGIVAQEVSAGATGMQRVCRAPACLQRC
jgi:hypothetical protein